MRYTILSAFILLLFVSCGGGRKRIKDVLPNAILNAEAYKKGVSSPVTIHTEDAVVLPYDSIPELLKNITYVPIHSEEPIGVVNSILVYKDRVYILDYFKSESIFIFDLSGKPIKVIDDKGGGPKEYTGLFDICISQKREELVVGDRLSPYILYYTLDGEFLRKERLMMPTGYLEMMGDYLINNLSYRQSYSKDVNYNLVTLLGDSIVRRGFSLTELQKHAVVSRLFSYNHKNELLYNPVLCDTIYRIINDSLYTAKYVVEQEKSIWTRKDEPLTSDEQSRLIIVSGYTMLADPIVESEDYLSFGIHTKNGKYITNVPHWYDKRDGRVFTFGKREDQTTPISFWVPPARTLYNGSFVGFWDVDQIRGLQEYLSYGDNKKLLVNEQLKSILADDANLEGILVLYDFR